MSKIKFKNIFQRGSKTYFYSSLLFPEDIQQKVFILYAFVRVVDDFVDQIPQDRDSFYNFFNAYKQAREDENFLGNKYLENLEHDQIVKSYVQLEHKLEFEKEWTLAFFKSMEMDIRKTKYENISETLEYIYGSASVIGLFMSRIMGLPREAEASAKLLGTAFQYINFIRDIPEDVALGRCYFPQDELNKFGFQTLNWNEVKNNKIKFEEFIRLQLKHYHDWQKQAEIGFEQIPKNYLIAIKTASDMYKWTGKVISRRPLVVYDRKVKPGKLRIFITGINNGLTISKK